MTACLRPTRVLLLVAMLAYEASAHAQARVVVLPFSGPQAGDARSALVRALEAEHPIVEVEEWSAAAADAGVTPRAASDFAQVARAVAVDAIVAGQVGRAGRRGFVVSATVRRGLDGEVAGRASVNVSNLPGVAAASTRLGARVLELLAAVSPRAPSGPAVPGDVGHAGVEQPGDDVEAPVEFAAPRPSEDQPSDRDASRRRGRSGRSRPGAIGGWLDLCLDVALSRRSFSLSIDAERDQQTRPVGVNGRPGVEMGSGVYVEMGARVFFYPLAIRSSAWWSGFGLELSFHHDLSLAMEHVDELGRPAGEIDASEYTLTAGALYRHTFGSPTRGATLAAGLGFGRFSFFVGPRHNDVIAPFEYDYLFVGASLYVPAATRHAGVDLRLRYDGVISIGEEALAVYNGAGETPSSHGFSLLAGISGELWRGLRWRTAFELLGFVTRHRGVGQGYGEDPSTLAVETLPDGTVVGGIETTEPTVDLFWRILLQLAYRFGSGDRRAGPENAAEAAATGHAGPERGGEPSDRRGWYDIE